VINCRSSELKITFSKVSFNIIIQISIPPVMGVESGHTTMLSLLDVINPVVNLGICVGFGTKLGPKLDLAKKNFDRAGKRVPTVAEPSSS